MICPSDHVLPDTGSCSPDCYLTSFMLLLILVLYPDRHLAAILYTALGEGGI